MLSSLHGIFSSLATRLLPAAPALSGDPCLSASRSISLFEPPTEPRTYPDRTSLVVERLQDRGERGGVLAERFEWLVRTGDTAERPFYREATYHLDRLFQLEPWHDGQNTDFEYLAYQIFEAIVMNKDIASFVYFLSVMGSGKRSIESLEVLARYEKMQHYFGLTDGVFPDSVTHFEYDRAARTVMTLSLFGPVRPEVLRFLSTAVLKREGKLPAAGIASDAYCTSAHKFVEAFGFGLEHPTLGPRVQKAVQAAGKHPLGFLWMNRLAHLLMDRRLADKVAAFVPEIPGFVERLMRREPGLSGLIAQIEAARRERGPEVPAALVSIAEILSSRSIPHSRRLADELKKKNVRLETHAAKAFEAVVRLSRRQSSENIVALYDMPQGVRGPAVIQMRSHMPFEEAAIALHEFVHVEQERLHGPGWVDRHVLEAEREALAVEVWFRIVNGDHRLYDVIAALSPSGFEQGLWIAAEQLYLRLKDLPV